MGLLPLIVSTLSIFVTISIITLLASFIVYKLKSPKKRPYLETQKAAAVNPVYIQKINYDAVQRDPEVNYYENVKKITKKHVSSTERFQVLNSQVMRSSTNFSQYSR